MFIPTLIRNLIKKINKNLQIFYIIYDKALEVVIYYYYEDLSL